MTYEQIETFLTSITYGSISAAAKHLYVSQSTISSRIQQLEAELGGSASDTPKRSSHHRAYKLWACIYSYCQPMGIPLERYPAFKKQG